MPYLPTPISWSPNAITAFSTANCSKLRLGGHVTAAFANGSESRYAFSAGQNATNAAGSITSAFSARDLLTTWRAKKQSISQLSHRSHTTSWSCDEEDGQRIAITCT